jgi:benzoate transport
MANNPQAVIDDRPMSGFQWRTVAIMIGLNALDGFDVLSISFASPGIAKDWGIDRAALGIVLSMELIGMSIGSLLLGSIADRIGRRATILSCLCVMAVGMLLAASSTGIVTLCAWRVLTGIGIGGMLAATNAAVAEASNKARRDLAVVLMAGGYPVGAIVGGSIAAMLLKSQSWHSVFVFGAVATIAFIPIVLAWAPESVSFLLHRRAPDALTRINKVLGRMGHPSVDALPDPTPSPAGIPLSRLFAPDQRGTTLLLMIASLAHIMTFYFILKWIPKIVVDMGFAPAAAAGVLVWANIGGASGSLLLGLLTGRGRLLGLTIGAMALSAVMVTIFGRGQSDLTQLSLIAATAGFFTNAGVVGLYALIARSFDTGVRATATGFVIGIGRGGSAAAPAVAGFLFAAGFALAGVSVAMALGSVVALLALVAFARMRRV